MLIDLSKPDVSPKTIEKYRALLRVEAEKESYGEAETIPKTERGLRADANYHGETRHYFVYDAWANGGGLTVDKAYRIFQENDEVMEVRQVESPLEIRAVVNGLLEMARRKVFKHSKDKK